MSEAYLFDQKIAIRDLNSFFKKERASVTSFGNTVNQTFEAYVIAQSIKWFQKNGWNTIIVNPIEDGQSIFKLKFNTKGAPKNYTYVHCSKGNQSIQIRHGLRVYTKNYKQSGKFKANIVCDLVFLKDVDLNSYGTNDALPNSDMLSFGEVKHMSAFAELVASFIGLVHELKPDALKRVRIKSRQNDIIPPFLYVSGILYPTAAGLNETIKRRKFDIDVYSNSLPMI